MPCSPESNAPEQGRAWERWHARLHYYTGLYLLFFLWLFAVTGLLLNHGTWGAGAMPRNRAVSKTEHRVTLPAPGQPHAEALALMQALQLEGELQWFGTPPDSSRLVFRVTRPDRQAEVRFDRQAGLAVVEQTANDALGTARALHLFTGVRMNDARNDRDWIVTKIWVLAMDAVAAGLLVLVGGGMVIWWRSGASRRPGLIALGAGVLVCGWFVVGLAYFAR